MAKVRIRDIAVLEYSDPDGDSPIGEGPKSGEVPRRRLNKQERVEMTQRQFEAIAQLMTFARSEHDTYCRKEGTDERDPDYVTRISTAEFSFYTLEPLTLNEFEELQNRVVVRAKQMDRGIHIVLGSFAVVTEDQQVMNVVPHITCGEPTSVTLLIKNLTSAIDVRYKEQDEHGKIRTLTLLDSSCFPSDPLSITIDGKKIAFQLNNIIPCTTPGETPFLTGIDICEDHTEAIVQKNARQLVARQPHLEQHPFSHMVVSNSVYLIPQYCLGAVMHVDPILSRESCKIGAQQEHKVTFRQSFARANVHVYTVEAKPCLSLLELRQLDEVILSPLREDAEIQCHTLSSMGFGPSDESMQELLTMIREQIAMADSPQMLQGIIMILKAFIVDLSENEQMKEIKVAIEDLRSDLSRPGAQEKAARIEVEAAKIPIDDRCSTFPILLEPGLLAVMASPPLLSSKTGKEAQAAKDFKEKFHHELGKHEKVSDVTTVEKKPTLE
jgi:hypothetical protein